MALKRTKPRRTITMGGFSFADGNIELIHPYDVPYTILIAFNTDETSLEQYFAFSNAEGVLDDDDMLFLLDLTAEETLELAEKVQEFLISEPTPGAKPIPSRDELSPDEENMISEFNNLLQGLLTNQEEAPKDPLTEEIDRVLGEDDPGEGEESRGDEPPC